MRDISFEEIELAIRENDGILDIIKHPNKTKYPNQEIYILNINNYVYIVPFVKRGKNEIFLKTIFPSRKLTKKYLPLVKQEQPHEKTATKK